MESVRRMDGKENPYELHQELGKWMMENMTIVRYNDKLQKTLEKIMELKERWKKCRVPDKGRYFNQTLSFTRQLWDMLELAQPTVSQHLRVLREAGLIEPRPSHNPVTMEG